MHLIHAGSIGHTWRQLVLSGSVAIIILSMGGFGRNLLLPPPWPQSSPPAHPMGPKMFPDQPRDTVPRGSPGSSPRPPLLGGIQEAQAPAADPSQWGGAAALLEAPPR